jgi:hypothetical protein
VGVMEAYAGKEDDECTAVQVRKFEGCHLLAEVENTESGGARSQTWLQRHQRKSRTSDTTMLGTFSDPIDL